MAEGSSRTRAGGRSDGDRGVEDSRRRFKGGGLIVGGCEGILEVSFK